ncbi:DNA methylase, adenine-specific [Comamonadaceae bacterium]
MNAVEIEAAISDLALQPFDRDEFPYSFVAAFGHKDTAIKRLRTGNNNTSDLPGGVLLRNNIHIAVCDEGKVPETLIALQNSPSTPKGKVKFILATDGKTLHAKELVNDEFIAPDFKDFPNHFGFFLPLAGISTIKEIKDNPIDVRATGRLNKLYVELLNTNPDWAKADRREDMNHFMARLVFCFFAEDTDIFQGETVFTKAVERMSDRDGSNTHEVLEAIFRAMNLKEADRPEAKPKLPNWVNVFPYVNGGLFSGGIDVPKFSRIARTYLMSACQLNWREINPDIFGSMIQAVADDSERGELGMHYTSVPNILKVLNPLFLDDLRAQLAEAGDNDRKLLNLRKRMARIRIFDPACGSGNFLVIAYKQMREIEAEINRRRGEAHKRTEIPITNFRGIEINSFPAEIARLALIIAEFQCDVLYRGQKDAVAEFLPLDAQNWIICGNSLRLDWLSVCPPTGTGVKVVADDLFMTPLDQTEIDFENEGGETYICGNPPYIGSNVKAPKGATKEEKEKLKKEAESRKADMKAVFEKFTNTWGTLDYVAGWFMKAVDYGSQTKTAIAFVATNSICQGQQVSALWPLIFSSKHIISFAHTSFKWRNLATKNAGVTVVIVGLSKNFGKDRFLYISEKDGSQSLKTVNNINAYLVPSIDLIVEKSTAPISSVSSMSFGSMPNDNGGLILKTAPDTYEVTTGALDTKRYLRPFLGTEEFIDGKLRHCIWIDDAEIDHIPFSPWLESRFSITKLHRSSSDRPATNKLASKPYKFGEVRQRGDESVIIVAGASSENREYLPVGYLAPGTIISNLAFGLFDAPLWNMALVASRLHLVWIANVCGALETRYRYSNTLGWNTFPVPLLTEQNKADLTRCAEDILLAREAHFPATIADLYDPETMPDNLRHAHERNDEVLERIYIGRRFRNDTERLEKLFELYTKMTAASKGKPATKSSRGKKST